MYYVIFSIYEKTSFFPDPNKVVHTELTLESQEFEEFEVDVETKITFCLKELKVRFSFSPSFSLKRDF